MGVVRHEVRGGVSTDGRYDFRHYSDYEYGFVLVAADSEADKVYLWCCDQFGPALVGGRWYQHRYIVWLLNPEDAIAFKLRWM